jgi:transposase-like protein
VIVLAVRWYLRFALSYRDVEELLAERGIQVDHVGTVASGPKVPPADSKVEPLPVQTAIRSAQSNQSWHRRWHSGTWWRTPV